MSELLDYVKLLKDNVFGVSFWLLLLALLIGWVTDADKRQVGDKVSRTSVVTTVTIAALMIFTGYRAGLSGLIMGYIALLFVGTVFLLPIGLLAGLIKGLRTYTKLSLAMIAIGVTGIVIGILGRKPELAGFFVVVAIWFFARMFTDEE